MKPFPISISLLALSAGVLSTAHAADWPRWRGSNFDGKSAESVNKSSWGTEGPKELWRGKVGIGWSSMTVVGGRVFTMGNTSGTDAVVALDAKTGAEIWRHTYPCDEKDPNGYPGTRCTPTVDGDRVYTVSRHGDFFCLNAATGKVIWSKNFEKDFKGSTPTWGYAGSPLVEGKLVIVEVGSGDGAVMAFDKLTGEVAWKSGGGGAGYASPVPYTLEGERAVLIFGPEGLSSLRIADGKKLWDFAWKTSYDVNASTPVVLGDKVFISSGYNTGCAMIQISGNKPVQLWKNKNLRSHMATAVYRDGVLYGFDENELRAIDVKTGAVKWSEGRYGKGSLQMVGDQLLVFGDKGLLALVEVKPDAFKEVASAQILGGKSTWIVPVLSNGLIYARSGETLVALNAGAK
jgi:outer membrane protein assembly factor BamB